MNTASTSTLDNELERIARKRAGAKMGWAIHASVYVVVNLMLAGMSLMSGKNWAIFPAVGWGIGLAAHGLAVFFATGGAGLHERLLQRERARLTLQRDPW
jgi:hypothetical protein